MESWRGATPRQAPLSSPLSSLQVVRSARGRNGKTVGVFKVSNAEKAMRVLSQPAANRVRRTMGRRPMHSR